MHSILERFVKPVAYVNAVCLVLVIIYCSIMAPTFNINFYERQFIRNNTHSFVRIEPEHLTAVTLHMMDYMRGKNDSLQIRTYINGEETYFFTERAVEHMVDVRNLFTIGRTIFFISIGLFIVSLSVGLLTKSFAKLFKSYRNAALCTAGLFALIGLIALINFEFAFDWFHHIFFFNDLWLLNHYDNLLNIVPIPFFISISLYIGTLLTLSLAAMVAGGHFFYRFFTNRGEAANGGA